MNWLGAPDEREPLAIRAMFRHGVHRYRRVPLDRGFGFVWDSYPSFVPLGVIPRKILIAVLRVDGVVTTRSASLLYVVC